MIGEQLSRGHPRDTAQGSREGCPDEGFSPGDSRRPGISRRVFARPRAVALPGETPRRFIRHDGNDEGCGGSEEEPGSGGSHGDEGFRVKPDVSMESGDARGVLRRESGPPCLTCPTCSATLPFRPVVTPLPRTRSYFVRSGGPARHPVVAINSDKPRRFRRDCKGDPDSLVHIQNRSGRPSRPPARESAP